MTPVIILSTLLIYTFLLFLVARITLKGSNNESYFIGNKTSPWYVVAYGMIGASLSGVTFMSVPGLVGTEHFSYLVLVFGYLFGYFVIAYLLLPLYYKLNLTSIYTYLEQRFGSKSYKTGSMFFILSRLIGSSFRMFLVVNTLQLFVFDALGVPFIVTVAVFMLLILLYTFQGGIKTIVWTDTLQTTFMLAAVVITFFIVAGKMNMESEGVFSAMKARGYFEMFITDPMHPKFFIKQFFSGMFITIVMTGLDQDMMQKNLSCRNLKDAKKNMITFSIVLIFANLMFLFLGGALNVFADINQIKVDGTSDELFPLLAFNYLGIAAGLTFLLGLISAAYSSADGTLTALTTSFCIDILGLKKKEGITEVGIKKTRYKIHIMFSFLMMLVMLLYQLINDQALINKLFTIAGYTYGPLLGLYSFGLFTKFKVKDKWVPLVCVLSPLLSYLIGANSQEWLWGYKFGFEILILNGLISFFGLFLIRKVVK